MTKDSISTIKSYFETGDKPTQTQFAALIESGYSRSYNLVNDYEVDPTGATENSANLIAALADAKADIDAGNSGLAIVDGQGAKIKLDPAIFAAINTVGIEIPYYTILRNCYFDVQYSDSAFGGIFYATQGGEYTLFENNILDGNGCKTNGVGAANSTSAITNYFVVRRNKIMNINKQVERSGFVGGGKAITFQAGTHGCAAYQNYIYNCYFPFTAEGNYDSSLITPERRNSINEGFYNNFVENCPTFGWFLGLNSNPTDDVLEKQECILHWYGNVYKNCGKSNNSRAYYVQTDVTAGDQHLRPSIYTYVTGSATYDGKYSDVTTSATDFSGYSEWEASAWPAGSLVKITDDGTYGGLAVINAKGINFGPNTFVNTSGYGTVGTIIRGNPQFCQSNGTQMFYGDLKNPLGVVDECMVVQPGWYSLDFYRAKGTKMPNVNCFGTIVTAGELFRIDLPVSGVSNQKSASEMDWGKLTTRLNDFKPSRFFSQQITSNTFDYNNFYSVYDSQRGGFYDRLHPAESYRTGYDDIAYTVGTSSENTKIVQNKTAFLADGGLASRTTPNAVVTLLDGSPDCGGVVTQFARDGEFRVNNNSGPWGNGLWNANHTVIGESHIYRADQALMHKSERSFVISGITNASAAVVTFSPPSGVGKYPAVGEEVQINSVVGLTGLNGRKFTIGTVTTASNTVTLTSANTTNSAAYSSGGTLRITGKPISATDKLGTTVTYTINHPGTPVASYVPAAAGLQYFDTTNSNLYVSVGVTAAAWRILASGA